MQRRAFISQAGILTFGIFLPKKYLPKKYFVLPYVPTETLFRNSLGGSWTNETTYTYSNTNNLNFIRKVVDGTKLNIQNCDNLLFQYCIIKNVSADRAADIQFCHNVEFDKCYFEDNGAHIYLNPNSESGLGSYNIHECIFKNATGPSNPLGQCVQINHARAATSCVIEDCYMYNNWDDGADPEDVINIHDCQFTSGSPLRIRRNYINSIGGETSAGPSASGGGILVSDNGSQYSIAEDNVVINPGQYGIGCASGTNCTIQRNKVRQPQQVNLPSNVGIYVYDANHIGCASNSVIDNQVNYQNAGGSNNGSYLPSGSDPGCTGTTSTGNNFSDSSITDQEPPPSGSIWWMAEQHVDVVYPKTFRRIVVP